MAGFTIKLQKSISANDWQSQQCVGRKIMHFRYQYGILLINMHTTNSSSIGGAPQLCHPLNHSFIYTFIYFFSLANDCINFLSHYQIKSKKIFKKQLEHYFPISYGMIIEYIYIYIDN